MSGYPGPIRALTWSSVTLEGLNRSLSNVGAEQQHRTCASICARISVGKPCAHAGHSQPELAESGPWGGVGCVMPPFKRVPRLEGVCLARFSGVCSATCTRLEEWAGQGRDVSNLSLEFAASLEQLPPPVLEQVIPAVIKSMAVALRRRRAHKGLLQALECLPQASLRKFDIGALFADVRLYGQVNSQAKLILTRTFSSLIHLTHLNLVSKCTDAMLIEMADHCPALLELNIPMSDITDRGLLALCGTPTHGCLNLRKLGIHNCMGITTTGVAGILRYLTQLVALSYDKTADAVEILAKVDQDYLRGRKALSITHVDQFASFCDFETRPDTISILLQACPGVESLRFYVSDSGCEQLKAFPHIKHLQLETENLSHGFNCLIVQYSALCTLNLTFRCMSHVQLEKIAQHCPKLSVLKLIGFEVEHSECLLPRQPFFQDLRVLDLRMIRQDELLEEGDNDDDTITPALIKFFLSHCYTLEELTIGAVASFFNKSFLLDLLATNPMEQLWKMVISVSQTDQLDLETAKSVIYQLPKLKMVGLARWNISTMDMVELARNMKSLNYDLSIN